MLGSEVARSPDAPLGSIAILAAALVAHLGASGMFLLGMPQLAVLHAYAVFVVLSIVAASHQLLPVLFRVPPLPLRLTLWVSAAFLVGFALLIAGFCGAPTMRPAAAVLSAAATFWVIAVFTRIARANAERGTAALFALSILAFATAVFFGATMLVRWTGGFAAWMPRTHATLMLVSFASIAIVALSFKFVPMFALSHSDRYGSRATAFAAVGISAAIALGVYARFAFAMLLAIMVFLGAQHVGTLRTRLRKKLDASLVYAAVAWCLGVLALIGAVLVPSLGPSLVSLALMGWIAITIFGYGLKIVGFLAWQAARERGAEALPPLGSAIPELLSRAALAALLVGTVATAASLASLPQFLRPSAGVYLLGSFLYAMVFVSITRRYVFAKVQL